MNTVDMSDITKFAQNPLLPELPQEPYYIRFEAVYNPINTRSMITNAITEAVESLGQVTLSELSINHTPVVSHSTLTLIKSRHRRGLAREETIQIYDRTGLFLSDAKMQEEQHLIVLVRRAKGEKTVFDVYEIEQTGQEHIVAGTYIKDAIEPIVKKIRESSHTQTQKDIYIKLVANKIKKTLISPKKGQGIICKSKRVFFDTLADMVAELEKELTSELEQKTKSTNTLQPAKKVKTLAKSLEVTKRKKLPKEFKDYPLVWEDMVEKARNSVLAKADGETVKVCTSIDEIDRRARHKPNKTIWVNGERVAFIKNREVGYSSIETLFVKPDYLLEVMGYDIAEEKPEYKQVIHKRVSNNIVNDISRQPVSFFYYENDEHGERWGETKEPLFIFGYEVIEEDNETYWIFSNIKGVTARKGRKPSEQFYVFDNSAGGDFFKLIAPKSPTVAASLNKALYRVWCFLNVNGKEPGTWTPYKGWIQLKLQDIELDFSNNGYYKDSAAARKLFVSECGKLGIEVEYPTRESMRFRFKASLEAGTKKQLALPAGEN